MSRTNANGFMPNVKLPAASKLATPEEIAGRTNVTKQSPPSSFKQLGPGDSSGHDLGHLEPKDVSGALKHGSL